MSIKIINLRKEYKDVIAVNDINLEIKEGELFALLGVNGAGKTTLIKMLSTLTKPTSGDAFINGYSINKEEDKIKELISLGVKCIAYISCFKDSVASSSLSGMEVLTSSGSLFADRSGDMWLDPYSDTAHDYLINIMKSAVKTGFSAVMLDNVCFPSEFYLSSPVYLSFTDGDTKNGALTEFINKIYALLKILKKIRPKKLIINAEVGFDSPDTTGKLYGLYWTVKPALGEDVNVTPNFEEAIIEGDFYNMV